MRRLMKVDDHFKPRLQTFMIRGPLRRARMTYTGSILLVRGPPAVFKRLFSVLRLRPVGLAAIGLCLLVTQAGQANVISTVDAPGVQSSSALNTTTIDFNSVSTGYKGSQTFALPGPLTATYVGTQFVLAADQYGGAGGVGNYLSIQANNSVTLSLSSPQAYFGMWLSAADSANQLAFYNGNQLVGSFSGAGPEMSSLSAAYLGNPNSQFLGDNGGEKYAYLNFYAKSVTDMFTRIVFTNLPGATNFESDNHSFSTTLQAPLTVPDPSSLVSGLIAVLLFSGFWLVKMFFASANI